MNTTLPTAKYFQKRYTSAIANGNTDKADYYKERLQDLKNIPNDAETITINKPELIAFLNAQSKLTHMHNMVCIESCIKGLLNHLELPISSVFTTDEHGELVNT